MRFIFLEKKFFLKIIFQVE